MRRIQCAGSILGLLLVCGCGGGTAKPTFQPHASTASPTVDKSADVAVTDPQLDEVPLQSEPGDSNALPGADAFAALVKAAETNDAEGWAKSEAKLQELGAQATAALAARLSDKSTVARELAAMFLAQIGPDASSAADGLSNLLSDESTFARVNAAAALSTFEGYAEQVTPVLIELLSDTDENVRLTAATSLRNVGPIAAKSVRALSQALRDPNPQVRAAAAATLGELGPSAVSSLPALRALRSDDDESVVAAAAQAIRQLDAARDKTAVATPASATE